MTFDDRLHTITYEEAWEIERRYYVPVAPGIHEVDFDFEFDDDRKFRCDADTLSCDADYFEDDYGPFQKLSECTASCGPFPQPLPCRMKVKHFVDGRAHSGELRDEARKLYNAMSFKVLRDGWGFNTFITVTAKYLGLTSHAEFAALIPAMNKAVAGWLNARPKRSTRFHLTGETKHSYIFVLERSGYTHGLHVHLLCSIPAALRKEFRAFLVDWWEGQAGLAVPTNAVNVQYSHSGGRGRHYANQAVKFRYMIKTVQEDAHAFDHQGRRRLAVDFMKPWLRHGERPESLPVRTRQIYGISRDLDTKARQKWGEEVGWTFVSKFDQRRLDELYSGSEVAAWVARFMDAPDWWQLY